MSEPPPENPSRDEAVLALERPDPSLLMQYALQSLLALFLAPVVFVPLLFKYHTLRYHLDQEGISVRWGVLFRREVHLTYRRIQDIHVQRNLIERWLGIGRVQVQTASGAAEAEMTLEGIRRYDAVRDFLYARMRGHGAGARASGAPAPAGEDEVVRLLNEVRDELAAAAGALERSEGS